MRNPVQKMLKAASQMKNNPQLAQREAQSPNKVNAIAAQMVIPEQQAMQNSKPIPHPVGSVLMQKLAQAQQAALAAKMPQPSEGGIAQMAAKGGVLKYVGGGYTGTMADVKKVRNKARAEYQAQPTRKEQIAKATEVTPTKLGDLPGMEEFQTEAKTGIAQGIESRNKAAAAAAKAKTKSQKVSQAKTAKMAANFETAVENMGPKPKPKQKVGRKAKTAKAPEPTNTAEKLIAELGSPYEEAKTARETREAYDAEANRRAGEATARANVRKLVEQGQTPAARIPQGRRSIGRGAAPDYRAQGIEQTVRATNVPGPKQVAEGQAAEAESTRKATRAANREAATNALKTQEGRNTLLAKGVSKDVPLDVATRVIQGRSDAARTKTLEGRRQIAEEQGEVKKGVNARSSVIGEKGRVVPRQPETPEQKARRSKVSSELGLPEKKGIASAASKEAREYMAGKEQPAEPTAEEKLPSKKKTADVTQGEATARLQKAKAEGQAARGETPATLHSKVEGITEGAIHSDPEVHDEVSRLASSFKAQNPDATVEQMGTHIMDNASEATKAKFMAKAGPLLEKYGVRFGKAVGSIGAYESAANIGNVAIDPTKSKADVAKAMGHEAVESIPALTGAAIGGGAGSLVAPGPGTILGGLAGGIAGAAGGAPAVSWMKEKLGMDQEGPQATARHTIPTVGDIASKVSEQFSGDNWNKSPAQQFKDEVAAMPEDEETLRLERMGRGEMSLPEIARGTAEPAAPQTAPGGSSGGAPSTGKGITSSPALRSSATGGGGASTVPAGGAAAPSAPQAPRTETQATQDQYAGDTSEGTPEGAVRELMKLRGPGYSYSPEVMGMLKDARDEDRQATALSMLGAIGTGLANRDRYAGAHEAGLLANQAFTSGREREDAAQQRFLQGIIHNEQVPFEQRQAAYEMYTKMQMAAAQNEALMARANLTGMYGLGKADIAARSREATQRDQYAKLFVNSMQKDIGQLQRQLATDFSLTDEDKQRINNEIDGLRQQVAMARSNMTDQSDVLSGLAGGETLGQNRPITTLKM